MRRNGRTDKNQPEIVKHLRAHGVSVQPMSSVGGGFPDLLWWFRGVYGLLEVKDPTGKHYGNQTPLTPSQVKFHEAWPGAIDIVWTEKEALDAVMRRVNDKVSSGQLSGAGA